MSVNELAETWRKVGHKHQREHDRLFEQKDGSPYLNDRIDHHETAAEHRLWVADELDHVARTAWYPVSEPPPIETAEERMTEVVVQWRHGSIGVISAGWVSDGLHTRWAHVRDVILMPPQGGE